MKKWQSPRTLRAAGGVVNKLWNGDCGANESLSEGGEAGEVEPTGAKRCLLMKSAKFGFGNCKEQAPHFDGFVLERGARERVEGRLEKAR